MALQQKIPVIPQPSIASYNYTDIADGTGIRSFYLSNTLLSGNVSSYILTQNTLYSHLPEISGNTASTGLISDLDFDLTAFNFPQDIKGTAQVNIPHIFATGGGTGTGYLQVFLRKWDGTTETEIVSATSVTLSNSSADRYVSHNIPLPITTLVHFAEGDTLRLTVQQWIATSTGNNRWAYGCDPIDRTGNNYMKTVNLASADTLQSTVHIPFRIDIQ